MEAVGMEIRYSDQIRTPKRKSPDGDTDSLVIAAITIGAALFVICDWIKEATWSVMDLVTCRSEDMVCMSGYGGTVDITKEPTNQKATFSAWADYLRGSRALCGVGVWPKTLHSVGAIAHKLGRRFCHLFVLWL